MTSGSTSTLNARDVTINLKLMRTVRFHHLLDPDGVTTMFGWNVYRLSFVAVTTFVQCVMTTGLVGFFLDPDDVTDYIDLCVLVQVYYQYIVCVLKFAVLLYKADEVRDVCDVARLMFLTSKRCREHVGILDRCRRQTATITDTLAAFSLIVLMCWLIFPATMNAFGTHGGSEVRRLSSIINLRYTSSARTHNRYFVVFYAMEGVVGTYIMYVLAVTDVLLLSICLAIVAQYEVLTRAFESVGYDEKDQHGNVAGFQSMSL